MCIMGQNRQPMFAKIILSVLLLLAPPSRAQHLPGWEETEEQAQTRFQSIANDIAAVARNRVEAAALIGVSFHESGFAPDVDAGTCYRLGSWHTRCDGG